MAHRFDSGMSMPVRTAVRAAAKSALAPLLKSNGRYLASLIDMPAPLRFGAPEDETVLNDLVAGNSPTVGIAIGRQNFTSVGTNGTAWRGTLTLNVYVCVRHQRSVMAALTGDVVSAADVTKDPGGETVLEHVFERLSGLSTGINVAPTIRADSEEPAFFGVDWQVWEQSYTVATTWQLNPNRDVVEVVGEVQVNNKLDGDGTVETVIQLEEPA